MQFRWVRFAAGVILAALVIVASHLGLGLMGLTDQPAQAQPALVLRRVDPVAIATQIYQQHPDFPLENTYLNLSDQSPAPDNTLVSRFIRYHIFLKDRPGNFRLDWKLSIADYLGAFQEINPDVYPFHDLLTENPMAGDIDAIRQMTREQRNLMVQSLFDLFTGQTPLS